MFNAVSIFLIHILLFSMQLEYKNLILKFLPLKWITKIRFSFYECTGKKFENDCFLKFLLQFYICLIACNVSQCLLAVGYRMIYVQSSFQILLWIKPYLNTSACLYIIANYSEYDLEVPYILSFFDIIHDVFFILVPSKEEQLAHA